ncbi:myelin protein zero-like protein 2 [Tiliqua scincoides]|uniref:myelin protein zero-like protein 2 n=1 Tax=Tiliqua scincoides TaxID=71010 RepID=UPI0034625F17
MPGVPPPRRPPGPGWLAAGSLLLLVLWPAAAVDIYTPGSLEALNGTDVRLKCTFSTFTPVGEQTTVTWHFQPQEKGPVEFVLYYHGKAFPPTSGRFFGRVTWEGNAVKNDASIRIWGVSPTDNGTFLCQVKNPPDVDGGLGEIQLSVVLRVHFSEIHVLALTIGCACALMIIVVIVVVVCRHRQRTKREKEMEMVEAELAEKEKLKKTPREGNLSEPGEKV